MSKSYKFKNYWDKRGLQSKRRSLQGIRNECRIFVLREYCGSKSFAQQKLVNHLKEKRVKVGVQLNDIHYINQVLTKDETALVVNTCKELATMGLGIDGDTCLMVINIILLKRIDLGGCH